MSESSPVCHGCGELVYDIDVRCKNCGIALSSTGAQRMIGSVVLDQYEVMDILGQGGMSVVYLGKHKITGQEVALKVLPPELAAYRDVKNRFLEEGRALAQLDHPNIVHLYNFGDDGDCLVLAMQFVRGVTWERLIMDKKRLSWQDSARFTCDVSNALDYAHGRGIIHRDMKPSNVLIRNLDGAATVMDFGIAKMQSSSKLTATGQTMGTVRYMSPEQVRGKEVDLRTDIYSLAMTTYESIVGETPFSGDTHFEIMTKHLSERPVPPSQRGIDLPPAFEAVLMQAIAKKPEDRQSSAREFQEQIERVLSRSPGVIADPALAMTPPLGKKDLAAAVPSQGLELTAAPGVVTAQVELEPSPHMRLGIALVGLLVAAALAATYALTRDDGAAQVAPAAADSSQLIVESDPTSPPDMPPQTATELALANAFVLPGLTFAVDETFAEDALRILSVQKRSIDEVREIVADGREYYQKLSEKEGWAPATTQTPLSVFLVPQSVLCDPRLYERGEPSQRCQEDKAWYRPHEFSLYIVLSDKGSMKKLLSYWVPASTCLHSSAACTDVIERKLGR